MFSLGRRPTPNDEIEINLLYNIRISLTSNQIDCVHALLITHTNNIQALHIIKIDILYNEYL